MSLGIQIGNEFLDLVANTQLEIEQQNVFLQFNDDLIGGYSLPYLVKPTPKNLRLLQYAALIEKKVDNSGIDAIAWDNGVQHSIGKVKIEKSDINLNKIREGNISCYYLTGASAFWQDIKNKKLRSIDTGGQRSFAWDDYNITGNGFIAHITSVINSAAGYGTSGYDYAFYPVLNQSIYNLANNNAVQWRLNDFTHNDENDAISVISFEGEEGRIKYISPFPYLVYILKKAVQYAGWTIKGDILNDPNFLKITMIGFRCIDWGVIKPGGDGVFDGVDPHDIINFNLSDHLPDISISEFLIALKNRFGWWYDFDNRTKQITIRHLKVIATQPAKDLTKYASPLVPKTIDQNTTIYALKNQFSNNLADGAPDFTQVKYMGEVLGISALPPASDDKYGQVYLSINENNFYICRLKQDESGNLEWAVYTYNIYDYLPEGYTEEITTKATAVGIEYDLSGNTQYNPRLDNDISWFGSEFDKAEWGINLCFFYGVQPGWGDYLHLCATEGIYNPYTGDKLGEWSLSFKSKDADGNEIGLYDREWKDFLDLLKSNETIEITLHLPFAEYLNLSFLDQIVIRNTRMFIKTKKVTVPYSGSVTLECTRI